MIAILCFFTIGNLIGIIFTLFYINFESEWKLLLLSLLGIGGTGISIWGLFNLYNIKGQEQKFITTTAFIIGFLLSTVVVLIIICYIIKDNDGKNFLRIRDILLGQKSYIEKYYETRQKELEDTLNLATLEERKKTLDDKEKKLNNKEDFIYQEESRIRQLGKSKLKLKLPVQAQITLTKEYIELMPSYFQDVANCILSLKQVTDDFLSKEDNYLVTYKAYLYAVATTISSYIFNGNSSDIRIHFRIYNKSKNGYEKIASIIGKRIDDNNMTFIPYNKSNMIIKSYECKRALIKSINSDYDYPGKNYKIWKDYMTYTFHSLTIDIDEIPLLSFGISVKNEIRYRRLFYFLNFIKFEEHLETNMIDIDKKFNIKKLYYGG